MPNTQRDTTLRNNLILAAGLGLAGAVLGSWLIVIAAGMQAVAGYLIDKKNKQDFNDVAMKKETVKTLALQSAAGVIASVGVVSIISETPDKILAYPVAAVVLPLTALALNGLYWTYRNTPKIG